MKRKLLAVDDDADLLRVVMQLLGYFLPRWELHSASSYAEGVRLIEGSDDWGGLLTDYNLLDGFGTGLITLLRARKPACPVILMSGEDYWRTSQVVGSMNIAHLLQKPFDAAVLGAMLERAGLTP